MSQRLRILFVEDNPDDVELELRELRRGGIEGEHCTVQTSADLTEALASAPWDIVISDYQMPRLSGLEALAIVKELAAALPFILVSGTVGEHVAVEAMRAGADDYVLKDNLTRLVSAVQREIRGAEQRRAALVSERALRLYADVGAVLGKTLDHARVLEGVPELVVRDFAQLCSIDLVGETGRLTPVAWAAAAPLAARAAAVMTARPVGLQQVGAALRAVEASASSAVAASLRVFAETAKTFGLGAVLSRPVLAEQRVVGALHLARREAYSELEQRIIDELANRIGMAVDNAALYARARQAVELRDEFLTIASHELRTPLAALKLQIGGLQELARRGTLEPTDERLSARLERSAHSLDRLTQLVEALLDVSRVTSGGLELELGAVDLAALAGDVVAELQPEATRVGSRLRLRATAPAEGLWDALRIRQVLANLLSNAFKYGAGKDVEVQVDDAGDEAILRVVDHGIGIPEAELERIFGRFERAVSSRNYGGLGLGLFVARRIVEAHGGRVSAELTPSGGATFVVRLPRQPAEAG